MTHAIGWATFTSLRIEVSEYRQSLSITAFSTPLEQVLQSCSTEMPLFPERRNPTTSLKPSGAQDVLCHSLTVKPTNAYERHSKTTTVRSLISTTAPSAGQRQAHRDSREAHSPNLYQFINLLHIPPWKLPEIFHALKPACCQNFS